MEGAHLPLLHSPQPTFQPALSAEALTLPSLLGLPLSGQLLRHLPLNSPSFPPC